MLKRPTEGPYTRTAMLRPNHWGWLWNDWSEQSKIVTRMGQLESYPNRYPKKVRGRPRVGWRDSWDRDGMYYSKSNRGWIQTRALRETDRAYQTPKPHQERRFRYNPGLPWDDNRASWDDAAEFVVEL